MEHSTFYVPNNKLKQETLTNNLNHDSHHYASMDIFQKDKGSIKIIQ